jgi:acyl-CoA reductase-like NAD-dependent aldehyde dehydrogenase
LITATDIEGRIAMLTNGNDDRFTPTLLLDATTDMKIMQEETFGPVLPIVGSESLGVL